MRGKGPHFSIKQIVNRSKPLTSTVELQLDGDEMCVPF